MCIVLIPQLEDIRKYPFRSAKHDFLHIKRNPVRRNIICFYLGRYSRVKAVGYPGPDAPLCPRQVGNVTRQSLDI